MYSHSTCGRRTREVRFRLFLTLGRASGRMRSKEIACRIDAPIVLKDSKILVRLNQSSAGYLPPKAAGVTERLRLIAIRLAATELPRRGSLLDDVHDSSVAADGHSIVDSWNAHTTDHAQFAAALTIRFLMSPPPPSATILSNVTCTAARSSGGRPRRCLERLGTPFDDQIKGFCRARATNNCTWQSEEATSRTVVPRPRRSFMTRTRHRLSVDTSRPEGGSVCRVGSSPYIIHYNGSLPHRGVCARRDGSALQSRKQE